MKTRFWKTMLWVVAALSVSILLSACGGSGGQPASASAAAATGTVALDVTDAPGLEYNNAWITVTGVWFHTSADAGTGDLTGWRRFDLPAPVTLDLAQLSNGVMYADTHGGRSFFDGLNL